MATANTITIAGNVDCTLGRVPGLRKRTGAWPRTRPARGIGPPPTERSVEDRAYRDGGSMTAAISAVDDADDAVSGVVAGGDDLSGLYRQVGGDAHERHPVEAQRPTRALLGRVSQFQPNHSRGPDLDETVQAQAGLGDRTGSDGGCRRYDDPGQVPELCSHLEAATSDEESAAGVSVVVGRDRWRVAAFSGWAADGLE